MKKSPKLDNVKKIVPHVVTTEAFNACESMYVPSL